MRKLLSVILSVGLLLVSWPSYGAIGSSSVWRIRTDGNNANGGGYDSTISGAGSDYTDQASAQLSLTDIVTIGGTSVTSVTGGFTSAMIGNCIKIIGDNYYFITARSNTNTITVDRNTGTAVGQSGKIGGAWAGFENLPSGGNASLPSITTPIAPGHTIYIRGTGSLDPSSSDYDYTSLGGNYWTLPSGDTTNGLITLIGYNGRPRVDSAGILFFNFAQWSVSHMKFTAQGTSNSDVFLIVDISADDIIFDQNGYDLGLMSTNRGCKNSWFKNTGSTSAGTIPALATANYSPPYIGNVFQDLRGPAIQSPGSGAVIVSNIFINNHGTKTLDMSSANVGNSIIGNTITGNAGDGIYIASLSILNHTYAYNNIITSNGGYGINLNFGSSVVNDKFTKFRLDYNNFGTGGTANTSGAYNNFSGGTNDIFLDPQFTNSAGYDYSVGSNMANIAFPAAFPGISTTNYGDLGGVQRQNSGGAAATTAYTFVQ